jgi:hypothetical protein
MVLAIAICGASANLLLLIWIAERVNEFARPGHRKDT